MPATGWATASQRPIILRTADYVLMKNQHREYTPVQHPTRPAGRSARLAAKASVLLDLIKSLAATMVTSGAVLATRRVRWTQTRSTSASATSRVLMRRCSHLWQRALNMLPWVSLRWALLHRLVRQNLDTLEIF